jgi:ketopantoate hydroxymethyltransferase
LGDYFSVISVCSSLRFVHYNRKITIAVAVDQRDIFTERFAKSINPLWVVADEQLASWIVMFV